MRSYKELLKEGKNQYSPIVYARVNFWKQFDDVFRKYGVESPSDGRLIMYVDTDKPMPTLDCQFDSWVKETKKWLADTSLIENLVKELPEGTKLQNGFNKRGFFVEIYNTENELKKL